MKVFLGGTCNDSQWRKELIPQLVIDFFDPVVDEWSDEAYEAEVAAKLDSNYFLYCLTPKYTGFFSFAEIVDESFHYSNQTIFCFLPEDEGETWTECELESLNKLGDIVLKNGGLWLDNLEEVAEFLNSTNENREQLQKYDFFISYGRKHSTSLASKFNNSLIKEEKTVWMDKLSIPTGVDFQNSINDGIARSDNFIYIISPHSVQSPYCKKELDLALRFGKRIIPILHIMEPGMEELIHDEVKKLNWLYFDSERKFNHAFEELLKLGTTDHDYLESHTKWLQKSVEWETEDKHKDFLLGATELILAEDWLQDSRAKKKKPSAGASLVEFIEASAQHLAALEKRRKRSQNLIKILSVVMTAAFIFAIYWVFEANEARDEAEDHRIEAEGAKEDALDARDEARRNLTKAKNAQIKEKASAVLATDAKNRALIQREIALDAKQAALIAQGIAIDARDSARILRDTAIAAKERADNAAIEALEKKIEADTARNRADRAKAQEEKRRLLSEARSLAEQSLLKLNDSERAEAAFLALNAFYLNEEKGGTEYNRNIYNAMSKISSSIEQDSSDSRTDILKKASRYEVTQIQFPAIGREFCTGNNGGEIHIWEFQKNTPSIKFDIKEPVREICYGKDSATIFVSSVYGNIFRINRTSGTTHSLENLKDSLKSSPLVAIHHRTLNDSSVLFCATKHDLVISDKDGAVLRKVNHNFSKLNDISISPNNNNTTIIIAGNNNQILRHKINKQYNAFHTDTLKTILPDSTGISSVAISPDGRFIACGSETGIIFLYTKNLDLISVLPGHTSKITKLQFDQNTDQLASSSLDHTVRLWNTEGLAGATKSNIRMYQEPLVLRDNVWIRSICYHPDSIQSKIYSCGQNGRIRIWPTKTSEFVTKLCQEAKKYNFSSTFLSDYLQSNFKFSEENCISK